MVNNMSDPVKNAEVEDVLSSIRRLVSEDKRPLQPSPQPEAKPDRLVLTPALRVEETSIPEIVEESISEAVDAEVHAALAAEERAVDGALDVADLSETPRSLEEDYAGDPYGFDDDDNLDGELDQNHKVDAPFDAPAEEVAPGEVEALSAKIAALETAIGDIADEWEPDGASADANAAEEAPAMTWEDVEPAADTEAAPEPDTATESEVTFSHRADDTIVDETTADETTAETVLQDVEEAEPVDEFVHMESAEPASDVKEDQGVAGFAIPSEDQLLDEETLREMITEIVHAELQGALGERITRNVRRLVRREIHRALTARDLD